MEYKKSDNAGTLEFKMTGSFGFSDNPKIRGLIGELEGSDSSNVTLDLSGLSHIDSSGLGMLVLVNDATEEQSKKLTVKGASGQVRKLLDISKFDQMMSIAD